MYAPLNLSVGVHYRPHEPDSLIALVKTETEVITFVQPLSPGNKDMGEIKIYLPVLFLVELCRCGLVHQFQPRMVKLGGENGLSGWHDESKLDKDYIQNNEIFIKKFTNRHNKLNINKLYG